VPHGPGNCCVQKQPHTHLCAFGVRECSQQLTVFVTVPLAGSVLPARGKRQTAKVEVRQRQQRIKARSSASPAGSVLPARGKRQTAKFEVRQRQQRIKARSSASATNRAMRHAAGLSFCESVTTFWSQNLEIMQRGSQSSEGESSIHSSSLA
jgi:hypothetical protein